MFRFAIRRPLACVVSLLLPMSASPLFNAHAEPTGITTTSPASEDSSRHSLIQRPRKKAPDAESPISNGPRTGTGPSAPSPQQAAPITGPRPNVPASSQLAAPNDVLDRSGSDTVLSAPPTPSGGTVRPGPVPGTSAAASVTVPSVPLANTKNSGTPSMLAAPGPSAQSGSGTSTTPNSRGFNNLLSRFPQLGPTLSLAPAPAQPAPTTQPPSTSPQTAPVPVITAPPPVVPPAQGVIMGSAILSWSANREPDLGGYKIYVGTRSGRYDYPGSPFTVGNTTTTTISNLPHGQTYFFAATAYDLVGNESAPSAEVSKSLY